MMTMMMIHLVTCKKIF